MRQRCTLILGTGAGWHTHGRLQKPHVDRGGLVQLPSSSPDAHHPCAGPGSCQPSLWAVPDRRPPPQVECGIQKLLYEVTDKKAQAAVTELLVLLVQRDGYSAADLQAGIAVFSAQMEDLR